MALVCQRLVNRRLEAPHVLHGHVLRLGRARPQVLVQRRENLRIEHLKTANSIDHALQLNALDVLVFAVDFLHAENVVAKIEAVESALLAQKRDHDASGPIEALAEQLLDVELVFADGDAIDELQGRPKPMEFGALVDVDDAVRWRLPLPNGVGLEEALDTVEDDLEN